MTRAHQAKKADAWMPVHIGPYMADTLHLTRDQHGGYFLLLMAYWRNRGPLADDDGKLAATVKATPAEWRKLRPVLAEFFDIRDGAWHQKRCDEELSVAQGHVEKRSSAGSENAKKRWADRNKKSQQDAIGMQMALPNSSQIDAHAETPSPIPEKEKPLVFSKKDEESDETDQAGSGRSAGISSAFLERLNRRA